MNNSDYWHLVTETAQRFVDDNSDAVNAATRPETAFSELIDGVVDENWSERDAIDCLQYSRNPSAEEWHHGGYKPQSPQSPFPSAWELANAKEDELQAQES